MSFRLRRSALYVPGSNSRALQKARDLPVDVLIFDLEDAVAPQAKELARMQVKQLIEQGGFGRHEIVVRINALESQWGLQDVAALANSGADAILIPKLSTPGDVMMVSRRLREAGLGDSTRLWAMIETCEAILQLHHIGRTAADPQSRLDVFVVGLNDLARELRLRMLRGRIQMLSILTQIIIAARAYGIDVLDGVYDNFGDADGFVSECQQARDFGMDGKTLIHPSQIAPCNQTFSPSIAELTSAREIVDAFARPENQDKGVIQIAGRMTERLHADMALRLLAIDQSIRSLSVGAR